MANSIKRANYNVIPLNLLKKKQVPENCDILFIAGPTKSFSTEETNYIRNYLGTSARLLNEKGELKEGKLLLMLEPALGANKPSGLKALLGEYGVVVRDDAVVYNKVNMPLYGMQTVVEIYISDDKYLEHEITKDIEKLTTVFYGSCALSLAPLTDTMAFSAKAIVQAPDQSWGETDIAGKKRPKYDEDADIYAPITLAIAAELREPELNPNEAFTAPPHATKAFASIDALVTIAAAVTGTTILLSGLYFTFGGLGLLAGDSLPRSLPSVGNVSRYFVEASLTVLRQASAEVPPMTRTRW